MKKILIALILLGGLGLAAGRAEDKTNVMTTVVTHVDAKAAAKLVADGKVTVLDVRTLEEFNEGHIAGATNINFMAQDFTNRVDQLDKSKTYLVHCASGGRSTRSLPKLKQLGFKQVIHLDGGLTAWEAAGNPVAKQ